jgi:hypothetical protein
MASTRHYANRLGFSHERKENPDLFRLDGNIIYREIQGAITACWKRVQTYAKTTLHDSWHRKIEYLRCQKFEHSRQHCFACLHFSGIIVSVALNDRSF